MVIYKNFLSLDGRPEWPRKSLSLDGKPEWLEVSQDEFLISIVMYIKKFSLFYVTKNRLSCGIWSESEKIESASLKKLSASLPEIIEAGLASSTNNKYYTGWKRWLDWCKENPEVNNLPGNPFFVALFFNHILLKYKTKGP